MPVNKGEVEAEVGKGQRPPRVGALAATFYGLVPRGQNVVDVAETVRLESGGDGLVPLPSCSTLVSAATRRANQSVLRPDPNSTPRSAGRSSVPRQADGRRGQPRIIRVPALVGQLSGTVVEVARRPVTAAHATARPSVRRWRTRRS